MLPSTNEHERIEHNRTLTRCHEYLSSHISTIKMSTAQLNPRPIRVSPLIKFGRWTFLGAGILWGLYHQNRLAKREVGIREIEAKEKVIRDAKLAEEKKRLNDIEMKELEEMSK